MYKSRAETYRASHEFPYSKCVRHPFKCPCKNKYQNGRHHKLATLRDRIHEILEAYDTSWQIENKKKAYSDKSGKHKRFRWWTVGKVLHKICSAIQVSRPYHRTNSCHYHDNHRSNKVDNLASCILSAFRRVCNLVLCKCLSAWCEHIPILCIFLMLLHQPKIKACNRYEEYHIQCKYRIQIKRNRRYEHLKTRHRAVSRYIRVNRCSPWWNRCYDAYRSCCCIYNISKLRSRYLILIGDRSHDRADSKTVKIIIDKYKNSQKGCRDKCGFLGLQPCRCPFAVSSRSPRLLHKHDYHTEQNHEHQNRKIRAVYHCIVERVKCLPRMEACHKQCSKCTTGKQWQIYLLCQ